MGHVVRIQSKKQFVEAIKVLNELPGMWHSGGSEEFPVLLVLDSHYKALVKAGVVSPNGTEGNARGKKAVAS